MNNDNLESILINLAEDAIPTAKIDLWPGLKKSLAENDRQTQQRKSIIQKSSISRLAVSAGVITLAALLIVLATPQGWTVAQDLYKYFQTVSQKSIPPQPVPVPAPTYIFGTKLIPQPTISTDQQGCGKVISPISSTFVCQLQDAQTRVGFTVKTFPAQSVQALFGFIWFDQDHHSIFINMRDLQGGYSLGQGLGDFPNSFPVYQDDVQIVKVGEFQAEYAKGDFYFTADKGRVWEPNAPLYQLRWKENEHWYWLTFLVNQPAGLQSFEIQGKLIKIAENLVSIDQGADLLAAGNQPSIKDSAGFTIKEPSLLPEGFQQVSDGRDGNLTSAPRVGMRYDYFVNGQVENTLTLDQMLIPGDDNTLRKEFDLLYRNPSAVNTKIKADEVVKINSITGYYLDGGESLPNALYWRDDEREYLLIYHWSPDFGGRLDKKTLIAIAESMK